jgi:RNA-binding protein YlmH
MPEPRAMEESLQVDQTVSLISGHEPDLEAGGDILTDAIQCQQMVGCSSEEDGVEEQARGAEEESVKLEHISLEESNEEEEEAEPDEDEQVALPSVVVSSLQVCARNA